MCVLLCSDVSFTYQFIGRAENNRANLLKIISFAMLAMSCLLALTWKLNLLEKKEDNSKYAV